MKAIMVMFDSLNRHFLPNYGCDWTVMPNFRRLEEKTLTFDNFYAASLPCMPARRELHTGRGLGDGKGESPKHARRRRSLQARHLDRKMRVPERREEKRTEG